MPRVGNCTAPSAVKRFQRKLATARRAGCRLQFPVCQVYEWPYVMPDIEGRNETTIQDDPFRCR
jgi:hypothetical protein